MNNNDPVIEFLLKRLMELMLTKQQCEDLAHEVLSLKNQLRDASAQIKELHKSLADKVLLSRSRNNQTHEALKCDSPQSDEYIFDMLSTYSVDAQECEHDWLHSKHKSGFVCFNCGARKS